MTIYELIVGKPAFEGSAAEIGEERPEFPPTTHRPLRQVVCACWETDPAKRMSMRDIVLKFADVEWRLVSGADASAVTAFLASLPLDVTNSKEEFMAGLAESQKEVAALKTQVEAQALEIASKTEEIAALTMQLEQLAESIGRSETVVRQDLKPSERVEDDSGLWIPVALREWISQPLQDVRSIFGTKPITEPLWVEPGAPKAIKKDAIKLFDLIRKFCSKDERNPKRADLLKQIVKLVKGNPPLEGELFEQLLKQVRDNPDEHDAWLQALSPVCELLVIAATIFVAPTPVRTEGFATLAAFFKDPVIGDFACLAALRMDTRPSENFFPPGDPTPEWLLKLPAAARDAHLTFGVGICEQMWHQRERQRRLRIPSILPTLTDALICAGAPAEEGIFRIPGSQPAVTRIQEAIDHGEYTLSGPDAEIHNVARLLKQWWQWLPEHIVPVDGDAVEIAEALPEQHRQSLKFMIGFLKLIAEGEPNTRMSPENLGICIGPRIMRSDVDPTGLERGAEEARMCSEFICALIKRWDTSDIYPLPGVCLSARQG